MPEVNSAQVTAADEMLPEYRKTALLVSTYLMLIFVLLYSFLYFSLRSEDYALLLGSIFAFSILVGIMYVTRKVDWYKLERK